MSEYDEIITAAAGKTADLFRRTPVAPAVRFYFRTGEILPMLDSQEPPEGYQLAIPECMHGDVPYSHMRAWLHERCRSVPCLTP